MPSNIIYNFYGNQVQISWKATPSELQPINKFVVVVEATPTRGLVRSRRQNSDPSGNRWEYETEKETLTITFEDSSDKTYTISVCAVNHLGRECSHPEVIANPALKPLSLGLDQSPPSAASSQVGKKESISHPLVIAISAIIPGMLLVLCVAVVCAVAICKHCNVSKTYYPARQGIFQGISMHVLDKI